MLQVSALIHLDLVMIIMRKAIVSAGLSIWTGTSSFTNPDLASYYTCRISGACILLRFSTDKLAISGLNLRQNERNPTDFGVKCHINSSILYTGLGILYH